MSKIVEIVDRKPIEWADMNADEFERDIEMLQEFCRYYIKLENIGLREIKGKNEFISLLEQEIRMNKNLLNYLNEESIRKETIITEASGFKGTRELKEQSERIIKLVKGEL